MTPCPAVEEPVCQIQLMRMEPDGTVIQVWQIHPAEFPAVVEALGEVLGEPAEVVMGAGLAEHARNLIADHEVVVHIPDQP